jgi:hypothetical protein
MFAASAANIVLAENDDTFAHQFFEMLTALDDSSLNICPL